MIRFRFRVRKNRVDSELMITFTIKVDKELMTKLGSGSDNDSE